MRLRPLFIFLALFAAEGALAQAYTWTDENGVVHYSDRPAPGAKQIVLPEANTIRTRATPASRSFGVSDDEESAEQGQPIQYESLEVVAPAPEETLWNIEGVLNVALAVSPALQPGHRVRIYFDGSNPREVAGTNFTLDDVFRGVHNIQAEIVDEAGELKIRSLPNRFYVQQTSIVRPR